MVRAFKRGASAYRKGLLLGDNPYVGAEAQKAWQEGWKSEAITHLRRLPTVRCFVGGIEVTDYDKIEEDHNVF